MSSLEIEDVLASIRRLVSDDLRPANRPGALLLTPALRVVPATQAPVVTPENHAAAGAGTPRGAASDARSARDGDDLQFEAGASRVDAPMTRTAMESAAQAFHDHDDEFILSLSDQGAQVVPTAPELVSEHAPTTNPVAGRGHEAVFAVLTQRETASRTPLVSALADAEGGTPIEDEAQWSVVDWDAPTSADEPSASSAAIEMPAMDAPESAPAVTLPFVSRRAPTPLTGDAPQVEPLILRQPEPATVEIRSVTDVAQPAAEAPAVETAVEAITAPEENAASAEERPVLDLEDVTGPSRFARGRARADLAEAELVEPVAPEFTPVASAAEVVAKVAVPQSEMPATAEATAPPPVEGSGAPVATTPWQGPERRARPGPDDRPAPTARFARRRGDRQPPAEPAPIAPTPAEPPVETTAQAPVDAPAAAIDNVFDVPAPLGAEAVAPKRDTAAPAARLSEAAFTRWPGWAQSAAEDAAAEAASKSDMAAEAPPLPPGIVPAAAASAPTPNTGETSWADLAEAEIHRQLAAELGPLAPGQAVARVPDLAMTEPALRDLVRSMIHEELSGRLGERITANVRKLVQLELQKTLSVQVTEFRSQRKDPAPDA